MESTFNIAQQFNMAAIKQQKLCYIKNQNLPSMDLQQIYEKGGVCNLEICGHNQGFCIGQPLCAA